MGYWNDDMEWVSEEPKRKDSFTWRKLLDQLEELPEEDLNKTVCFTDCGGSESYGVELKRDKQNYLYIKGK